MLKEFLLYYEKEGRRDSLITKGQEDIKKKIYEVIVPCDMHLLKIYIDHMFFEVNRYVEKGQVITLFKPSVKSIE